MATSVPMERSTPLTDPLNTSSSTSTSAFDRAKLFRARLAATRSNIASSSSASPPPTAVPGLPAPTPAGGAKQRKAGEEVGGKAGVGGGTDSAEGGREGWSKGGWTPVSTSGEPIRSEHEAASRPPSTTSTAFSPVAPKPSSPSFPQPLASAASYQPYEPYYTDNAYVTPYPIPPPGAMSTYSQPQPYPSSAYPAFPSTSPPHISPSEQLSTVAGSAPQVLAAITEQQKVASAFVPSPVSATRPLSTAMFTAAASTSQATTSAAASLATAPTVSTNASPPGLMRRASSPAVPKAVSPASAATDHNETKSLAGDPTSGKLNATTSPFSPALSSFSPNPTIAKSPSPIPLASAPTLPRKPSPAPPAAITIPLRKPSLSPSPVPTDPTPSSGASETPLFSLSALEKDFGGPRAARRKACEVLGLDLNTVQGIEGEGVDAAVSLRRAEKVEGELMRVWKKIVPSATLPATATTSYITALQSLFYLFTTLPSLPTFSSTSSDLPGPLIQPLVDVFLRLGLLTIVDEKDDRGGETSKEAKQRVVRTVEAWTKEVERLKTAEEKAQRTTDRTSGEELRDARLRISKLDTRLAAVQSELKAAQGDVRDWKERAVKAEGRLEEKPSRRVALLLEQVDSLTSSRTALQEELNTVQSAHDEIAAELVRLRASSPGSAQGDIHASLFSPEAEKAREKQLVSLEEKIQTLEVRLKLKEDASEADQIIFDDKERALKDSLEKVKKRLGEVEGLAKEREVKGTVEKRAWEREKKELGRREDELKREVLRLRDRERELEKKVKALPGSYPPSPEKTRNSVDSGPSAVEESLRAQIDSLEQQLKTSRQEVHNNKYVISKLAGQVKSLNRDVADKMEENAELMLRLASEG